MRIIEINVHNKRKQFINQEEKITCHPKSWYRMSGGVFIFSNSNKKRNNRYKVLLAVMNDTMKMRILFFKAYVV